MHPVLAIAMTAALSGAAEGPVTAHTGPPELLVLGYGVWMPLDRKAYDQEVLRLAARKELVPLREWPALLPPEAPVFLNYVGGWLITVAVRGDASSGFGLLADLDHNGLL